MKIYTKSGDKGQTALLGGTRVSKDDLRIHSYGTIDELNSYIGLLRDQEVNHNRSELLKNIQDTLFVIGSSLAADPAKKSKHPVITLSEIQLLETSIDSMEEQLPELKSFILPGGHTVVSYCHIARCVCRRAERHIVGLSDQSEVDPLIIQYTNRLSDFLFVLARKIAQELNVEEVKWESRNNQL